MTEAGHEHGISRRAFVTGAVGLLGGIIAAIVSLPAIGYLLSPAIKKVTSDEWVPLGNLDELPLNHPFLFSFTRTKQVGWERTATSYGAYVIRKPGGKLDVFSNVCTHLSCRVSWSDELERFVCPCHDGYFDLDGSIISGPQPRPLDRFEYKIEDETLMIHIVEA